MALEDKFDDIKKLIDAGKEKGYLTYDEVNDLIPHDVHSPEDLDDLITTIGGQGIDVLEGPKSPGALDKFDKGDIEAGEDVELDLTPGALEKTNDPVRMYLREMGTVPLLTREGEVEIAKRIERGQLRVLKALSRSPIVIREIVAMGEDLKRGVRSIKEVVLFDEDEITEDVLLNRMKAITGKIDDLFKHYKKSEQLLEKLAGIPPKKNARLHRKTRWLVGREQVGISRITAFWPVTSSSAMSSMPLPCRAFNRPEVITTFLPSTNCFLILPTSPESNLADSVSSTVAASLGKIGTMSMGMPIIPR